MANLNARNVPDTVAEGFAELAREHGMSREAYLRKLVTEAVAERSYRAEAEQIANDPEEQTYREAMKRRRAETVRRWDREDRAAETEDAA